MIVQTSIFILESTFAALPIPEAFGETPYLEEVVENLGFNGLVEHQNKILEAIPFRNALRYSFSAWVVGKTLGGTASMLGCEKIASVIKFAASAAEIAAFGAFLGYQHKMSKTVLWEDSERVMR